MCSLQSEPVRVDDPGEDGPEEHTVEYHLHREKRGTSTKDRSWIREYASVLADRRRGAASRDGRVRTGKDGAGTAPSPGLGSSSGAAVEGASTCTVQDTSVPSDDELLQDLAGSGDGWNAGSSHQSSCCPNGGGGCGEQGAWQWSAGGQCQWWWCMAAGSPAGGTQPKSWHRRRWLAGEGEIASGSIDRSVAAACGLPRPRRFCSGWKNDCAARAWSPDHEFTMSEMHPVLPVYR